MIRRLLFLVLLLAIGFGGLWLATRDEAAADTRHDARPATPDQPRGIELSPGSGDEPLAHVVSGPVHIPRKREVLLPDGRRKLLTIYELDSKDSRTAPNNAQLLLGVTVRFFKIVQSGTNASTKLVGTMKASRAELQLSQDKRDRALIAEDKQMEFTDVVFETTSDAAVPGATIKVQRLSAMNLRHEVRLWTSRPDEPVSIVAEGANGFRIDGRGLQAFVPSTRQASGEVSINEAGVRFSVTSDPVLVRNGFRLSSKGSLNYQEDPKSGGAIVTMVRDVQLEGLAPSAGDKRDAIVAKGDRLRATLMLSRTQNTKSSWNRITMFGAPITVHSGNFQLSCDRLDALPDMAGEPSCLIASGNDPVMSTEGNEVSTQHRIHLDRPVQAHSALLSAFGIVPGSIPDSMDHVLSFSGQTKLRVTKDNLLLTAARGMTLIRGSDKAPNAPTTVLGFGSVHLENQSYKIAGDEGFRYRITPQEDGLLRQIELGRTARHRFVVKHDSKRKDQQLKAEGTGTCRLSIREHKTTNTGILTLRSEKQDIRGQLLNHSGKLDNVADLRLRFRQAKVQDRVVASELLGLEAQGSLCKFAFETSRDAVQGHAKQIRLPAPGRIELADPEGAELSRKPKDGRSRGDQLSGRKITVCQLDDNEFSMHATGETKLRVHRMPTRPKGREMDLELSADEIRALPYLVPPRMLPTSRLPAHVAVLSGSESQRHLFAKGNIRILSRNAKGQTVALGFGEDLAIMADEQGDGLSGRLSGHNTRLAVIDRHGQENLAKARVILFSQGPRGEYLSLLPVDGVQPELSIPAVGTAPRGDITDASSRGRTIAICDGRVEVEPRHIRFCGPVRAHTIDAQEKDDPKGLALNALDLTLDRDEKGEVDRILARKDLRFWWGDVSGNGDELRVNPNRNLLILCGKDRPAALALADGNVLRAAQLNYNYVSGALELWKYRLEVVSGK